MMWLAIMGLCTLGAIALSGDENKSSSSSSSSTTTTHSSNDRIEFTKDYVRENLDEWYYSNWDCEEIAYQLQDNWLKDDVESMLRRGYRFYECVEKLRADGKLDI